MIHIFCITEAKKTMGLSNWEGIKVTLWDQLDLQMDTHRAITLVGGGGKTSLMYALAHEAREAGKTVIVTTSTHIERHPGLYLTKCTEPFRLRMLLKGHGIVLLGKKTQEGKLCGVGTLRQYKDTADIVLIEGDGAKRLPLKAPSYYEPVIPIGTDTVLAVAGIDSLDQPIRHICHRPEQVCSLLGKAMDELVSTEDIAQILSSPEGGYKSVADYMAFRCVINKADINPIAAQDVQTNLRRRGIYATVTSFQEEERGGICWF